ncbi:cytochrome P450 [Streptomyces sp. NPDC006012]|uniref:cytochrome P450 n=1 Tax=Streptomyces sp. NPDC006012 TaxID=3364739 RepID=UPI0036775C31
MSETTTDIPAAVGSFPVTRDGTCPFDPPAAYAELRSQDGPMDLLSCPAGIDAQVVSKYDDVRSALINPKLSSHAAPSTHVVAGGDVDRPLVPGSILHMDGTEHARLRRLLTPEFTVKRVEAMRPYIRRLIDEHIDVMLASTGPVDLYHAFALPIPSMVICELLGVAYGDRDRFQRQTGVMLSVDRDPAELEQANAEVMQFMEQLVTAKAAEPADDLLGRLIVRARKSGQELSIEELTTLSISLLVAGHETTANMIGLSTLALLRRPDQLEALRADPGLAGTAVNEMLRYISPVQFGLLRHATEDAQVGDGTLKAGEWLVASLASGNRDESVFPDPDRIDLRRHATAHLAFGYGIHQCLGQQLARVELQEVFARLYQRIPTLRLAVPFEDIRFKDNALVYGVRALPVTWDKSDVVEGGA